MLAQRTKLTETGEWMAREDAKTGELRGENQATQDWIVTANSDFSKQNFENEKGFTNFIFPGDVEFTGATFSGEAQFEASRFSARAQFWAVTFSADAQFGEATFSGEAQFGASRFSGEALFRKTTFNGNALFWKRNSALMAVFDEAMFNGNAWFWKTEFNGDAGFLKATFRTDAVFQEAKFSGYAMFGEAKFSGNAQFSLASFESFASFSKTIFQKEAGFVGINGQNFFKLEGAVFFLVPDFLQAHFAEAPRLDGIRFGAQNETYMNNLTSRWRTLKRLAVEGHDHERELDFMAEEIKSLRDVKGKPWVGSGRSWMGFLYQWFSDFGRSVARPFIWWVIVTAGFVFYYLSNHPNFDWDKPSSMTSLSCSGDSAKADPMTAALYLSVHNGLVISGLSRTEIVAQSYACLYGSEGKRAAFADNAVCRGICGSRPDNTFSRANFSIFIGVEKLLRN